MLCATYGILVTPHTRLRLAAVGNEDELQTINQNIHRHRLANQNIFRY